ncbi:MULTISPECIES: type II toxin-antitoxin system prevent-host-death family antitoxin [Pseudomonadota]|jgi:prevent-host-death family protein|uniref:type II toxin-antitoxin system Phd/YefM family antitoxin n=1 Tax=Pseudomonadota TaxID=1224 RepID=UPI00076A093E|nr:MULTISPECIES: type II toxin-antitoxin system prevent-host-death family antitoxin [Pseudomonadota]MAF61958.1 type II toxin-antitoxin system prevent-host-death family antitoxin [Blastomonas sp.]|tara:strand:- start:14887 stop:15144 length:258 start_codon:yes stop_codon:yes gene_type:complete
MDVSVSDAKAQLTDLVRRAQAGEEVVLTRHGQAVVRIVPVAPVTTAAARKKVLETVRRAVAGKSRPGAVAARSQDYLYGDDGLPR